MTAFNEMNVQMQTLHIDEDTIIELNQYSGISFQDACLERNSRGDEDNTGLRVHKGAHVACLYLKHLKEFLYNKRILEIGCGVGILGVFVANNISIDSIVLTDGNMSACRLAAMNAHHLNMPDKVVSHINDDKVDLDRDGGQIKGRVHVQNLSWTEDDVAQLKSQHAFEVIIGCELMYYKVDLTALASTVTQLLSDKNGLFMHAHIFRKHGQEQELIDVFTRFGFGTFETPVTSFISPGTLREHAEYYKVRCLMSGKLEVLTDFADMHPEIVMIPFTPILSDGCELGDEDEEDGDDDDEDEPKLQLSQESLAALLSCGHTF